VAAAMNAFLEAPQATDKPVLVILECFRLNRLADGCCVPRSLHGHNRMLALERPNNVRIV
jgi:hypothetical protein